MRRARILKQRFASLFRRRHAESDLDRELALHLEQLTKQNIAAGMSESEARLEARREFGSVAFVQDACRDTRRLGWIEDLRRDLRYALRQFARTPAFTLTVVLSLAFGVGANTAIFSVVHGVLIQPLAYPEADALVGVYNQFTIQGQVYKDAALSPGMYLACRSSCRAFEHFGVWTSGAATVTGAGEPEQVTTVVATQDALPALGVQPSLGRWFSAEEDSPAGARAVVLSHGYWQRKFGGDPAILGRTVVIDFTPHQVVGVAPPGFRFVDQAPDLILAQRIATNRSDEFSYAGVARLKPGLTVNHANQDVARVWRTWGEQEGLTRRLEELAVAPNLRPLKNDVVGDVGKVLKVLMGAVGLLLLLVCANVASLVIVRARTRRQEFAIRAALGAGRGRILREQLAESLALGLIGGALGLALAWLGIRLLVVSGPVGLPRLEELAIGPAVLAFAFLCSLAASLLFGLVAVVKVGVAHRLRSARGMTAGREHLRAQRLLVVGQVAIALVLLVGSGLMLRTLHAIQQVAPGFSQPEQIQTVRISIPGALAREPERVIRMQKEMLDRFTAIPGVTAAGFGSATPLDDTRNGIVVAVEGKTDPDRMPPNRQYRHASPGLFAAQGTRLLAGRDFTWNDVFNQRLLAVVSENMARETWGEPREAIGKRIRIGRSSPWSEVIGVVENVHSDGLHLPAPATVYARAGVESASVRRAVTFAIRTRRAGSQAFVKEVAAAVHEVSPSVPLAQVRTLADAFRRSLARTSFTVALLSIAAAMALGVAIIGVYGILAYAATERRREVGIRLALGAEPAAVRSLFVRQGLVLATAGGIVGLAAAAALTRWISSLLFGVAPLDPLTYAISVAALAAVALAASYLPARRAAAIDPIETLRAD